jgi:NADPH-dependent curcumin reductase CurA
MSQGSLSTREEVNRQVVLASRPSGYPTEDNFRVMEAAVPELREGQVLVRTLWLSLDPYMRGRMGDGPSYAAPHPIGQTMPGATVGKVVASRRADTPVGLMVEAPTGWQDYLVLDGRALRRLDPAAAPLSTALGVLGMPGLTAYHGLFEIGRPQIGETAVVSAAAGAVGAVVGQLAKLAGCRVVGIAGTETKVSYLVEELGFDAAINYKTEPLRQKLAAACPRGVDVYFDNVGGAVTDAVMEVLADRARVVICGQISQYNLEEPDDGPRNLRQLLIHQATMEGFLVGRFANRADAARERLTRLVQEGKLRYKEDVMQGLENAPRALIGMMRGENFGKQLVRVADE